MVAAAVIGGAVVSGVGGAISSSNQADAAQGAADTQASASRAASEAQLQANRESIQFQRDALAQQREDTAPYREAGYGALRQLSAGTSPGGEFTGDVPFTPPGVPQYKSFGAAEFFQDPSYKFRVAEGMKALDRTASARGNLVSGRALKDVERYGQDMASQEYQAAYGRHTNEYTQELNAYDRSYGEAVQRYNVGTANMGNRFNRLSSVAGTGQTAVQQLANATGATAANIGASTIATGNQIGANIIGAGNASAAGTIGAANARASGYQNLAGVGNSLAQYSFLRSMLNPQGQAASSDQAYGQIQNYRDIGFTQGVADY